MLPGAAGLPWTPLSPAQGQLTARSAPSGSACGWSVVTTRSGSARRGSGQEASPRRCRWSRDHRGPAGGRAGAFHAHAA